MLRGNSLRGSLGPMMDVGLPLLKWTVNLGMGKGSLAGDSPR